MGWRCARAGPRRSLRAPLTGPTDEAPPAHRTIPVRPPSRGGGARRLIAPMFEYLRRLATTGAAYTASSVVSKLIAVFLLPIYTHYLSPSDYGAAEVMLASVIAASIVALLFGRPRCRSARNSACTRWCGSLPSVQMSGMICA